MTLAYLPSPTASAMRCCPRCGLTVESVRWQRTQVPVYIDPTPHVTGSVDVVGAGEDGVREIRSIARTEAGIAILDHTKMSREAYRLHSGRCGS